MSLKHAFAALVFMSLAPNALAQQDPEEEVVVRPEAMEEAVRAFVGTVTLEAGGSDQVAVWSGRLCIGVMGLRGPQAQAVIDRIAMNADNLDVDLGRPGCQPNLLIIFTSDSDRIARVLVDEYRRALAYHTTDGVTQGRSALEDFAATPRAVRWWHVSSAADETGSIVIDRGIPAGPQGSIGDSLSSIGGPQVIRTSAGGSRIERPAHQAFTRAVIVVDTTRVAGMRVDSLANYVSMAALAQLNPDADTSGYPTILNAFRSGSPGNAQLTLTDWDMAYLEGLYNEPANRTATIQRGRIQRTMLDDGD